MNVSSHQRDKANVAFIQGDRQIQRPQDSVGPLVCKENRITHAEAPRGRNLLSLKLRHTLHSMLSKHMGQEQYYSLLINVRPWAGGQEGLPLSQAYGSASRCH